MLNRRQRAILATLIQEAGYVPVSRLAEDLGVTPRSIRLDLEAIEASLRTSRYPLERHKHHGVRLSIPPEGRMEWLANLGPAADTAYRLSPEERQLAIVAALLRRSHPISLGRLADELFVSRRTLAEDLKHVDHWLSERRLQLRRLPVGLAVVGSERAWRRALTDLVPPELSATSRQLAPLLRPLPAEEMAQIEMAVVAAAEQLPYQLADIAIAGLVYHLAVAVMRLRSGHDIVMDPVQQAELRGRPEWAVARQLALDLRKLFAVHIPDDELGYITLHLLGAKTIRDRASAGLHACDAQMAEAVGAFIRAAGAHLSVDLTTDEELRLGLILHLRAAVYRLRYGLRLVNPLRQEIEEQYGFLVEAAQAAAPTLNGPLHVQITPDELTYLAIHLGASLERESTRATPKALLVCGSGIGTARLLQSRMQRVFPDVQILDVLPVARLHQTEALGQADVLISTVPVAAGRIPVIIVNPFLTPEDVRQIRKALLTERPEKASSPERMRGPMLQDVLTDDLVSLDVTAGDWEQAIRLAGEPLVEAGCVDPRFVEAMVETVRRIGPYVVIDPGVALPHARPEDGVKRIGFSFVRLREPVNFGHEANDPVRLVIAIASPDAQTHLRALQELAGLLTDPAARKVFEQGSTPEILTVIRQSTKKGS
ncbi:MAG TPA: BglG family transcription antiterminator [Symbiobacteriaceae bacterium]|nr:BglG family transcription antiterminator [Symbiobacteriaceae bacterium]